MLASDMTSADKFDNFEASSEIEHDYSTLEMALTSDCKLYSICSLDSCKIEASTEPRWDIKRLFEVRQ